INTGLSAYQLADPRLLADLTRNNLLQANDTVGLQRVIGQVPMANVPALPTGITPPATTGADPRIYIPQDLSGLPGDSVTVPVRLRVTEPAGITLSGFDLVIEYDPAQFTVTGAQLGALVIGQGFNGFQSDPAPGILIYTAFSGKAPEQLPVLPYDQDGDLLTLTFVVREAAAPGPSSINLRLSWNSASTAAFDRDLNELVLAPTPTNAATDSVDGVLTVVAAARVTVPQDLTGRAGDAVTVPVRLRVTEPQGVMLSGLDFAVAYDSGRFTLTGAQLGELLRGAGFSGSWSEPVTGTVIYTASSSPGTAWLPLGTQGDLFTLSLTVKTNAAVGAATINLLAAHGTTTTAVYDGNLEALSLYPPPTNVATDSVDGVFTIEPSPPPTVSFTAATQTGAESTGTMKITAQLSAVHTQDVTIPFTLSGTGIEGVTNDYTITATPITISAGQTSQDITITVNDDLIVEGSETVVVTMGNPSNATQGAITKHTATITDNDVAGFSLSETTATVTEPNTTDTFTVVLTQQPLSDVVFSVLASDATEGRVDKATLTFTPANWNTAQTVTITALTTSHSLTWTLGNLSGLTGVSGSYELQLTAGGSGIQDAAGNALGGDASDAWTTLVVGPTWQNPRHPCDVTDDGYITAIDVLTLISDINTSSSRDLATASHPTPAPPPFLDPSGDGQLTPTDVLIVINYINRFGAGLVPTVSGGEGEFTEPPDVILRLQIRDTDCIQTIPSVHPTNGRRDTLAQAAGVQGMILRGPTEQGPTVTAPTQVRLPAQRPAAMPLKSLILPERICPTKRPDDFVDMPSETTELEQAILAIAAEVATARSF
ncbi:MAG: cohesin domain-containing protein, partial [Planctomycetota bacterium]|nr:cohesin domain-containing protein [Planctomycetota bacterium]